MVLPFSGNQLKRLGDRLSSPDPIADDDYVMLAQVAATYQSILDKIEQRLQNLGYQATTRVKTTGTLIDKLRRTPHLRLNSIHDLAGARIVIDGGRREQDQVASRITEAFADCAKPPELVDRRKNPSHGYRAVHIIVFQNGIPVEIQVRTKLQDSWAQITEKLGDTWGRGLRYGLGPDDPDTPLSPGEAVTRSDVMAVVAELGDTISALEEGEYALAMAAGQLAEAKDKAHDVVSRLLVAVDDLEGRE